jgi:predicted negative regulator of RcsB-dependent stress response
MVSVQSGNSESARVQANLLNEEFGGTAYAALASLVRARAELDAGDRAAARQALEQAIETSPDPALTRVAALRLARIQLAEGDLDAASATVDKHDGGAFGADFDALRGDIATAAGEDTKAREAYTRAIAAGAVNAELLKLKLDNLPPAG